MLSRTIQTTLSGGLMENEYINDIVSIVKCHTQSKEAISLYKQLNIVDFIRDVELECSIHNNPSQTQQTCEFVLSSRDLLFLCDYTDINKLGTYHDNLYKSFSECIVEHWEDLNHNVVDFYQLISEIRKKTNFRQITGYHKNLLEICLTTSLFSTAQLMQLLNHSDVNVPLHKCGSTALQHILSSDKAIAKLNELPSKVLEKLFQNTKYNHYNYQGIDVLETLWAKKHLLKEDTQHCMDRICKPLFLKQIEKNYLILECIFYGKKKDLFSEKELKQFIDDYIGLDFSINFINKNHKMHVWNYKAKNLVSYIQHIENLPEHLVEKIKEIENHPQFIIAQQSTPSSVGISEPYLVIDHPLTKQVSDHVLYYILEKCELVFKNTYFELQPRHKLFSKINIFKDKNLQQHALQH